MFITVALLSMLFGGVLGRRSKLNPSVSAKVPTASLQRTAQPIAADKLGLGRESKNLPRRELLSRLAAGIAASAVAPMAANAVSARTGLSSPINGEYDDANHPGCLRSVKVVGPSMTPAGTKSRKNQAVLTGVDGLGGVSACPPGQKPTVKDVWKLKGVVAEDGQSMLVDFSPKGGPGELLAKYEGGDKPGLVFPDGNKWSKVLSGTPERRPSNPKTLNSDGE